MKNSKTEEDEAYPPHPHLSRLTTPRVAKASPSSSSHPTPLSTARKQQETNDNKQATARTTCSDIQQQPAKQLIASSLQQQQESLNNIPITTTTKSKNNKKQPPQHQPRPIRPNLRRQVIVTGETTASVPVMTARPIELATVLPVGATAALVTPPKRPAHLPARYATIHHPSPVGSAAVAAAAASGSNKPNRYAWAQVQQWQAAAAAAHQQQVAVLAAQQQDAANNSSSSPHNRFQQHFSSAASRVLIVNPMHIVNISKHTKSRLIKSIEGIKRFSEKWFSHVLLLLFLAVYACFGAYIFISFEAPTEFWEKQLIIDTRLKIVNDSWYEAHNKNQQDFLDLFKTKFEDYERILNRACASGMTSNSMENQWTFWGSLFYSMTVFTTIGYGHLTPITFAGRVATMVYAIFGIPILLMVLADLGKLLTRIIKYAFKKFRYLYNKLFKKSKTSQRTRKLIQDNTNQYIGVAKGALARGMATYIQPNYDRIPKAATLLREKLTWRSTLNSKTKQQSSNSKENIEHSANNEQDIDKMSPITMTTSGHEVSSPTSEIEKEKITDDNNQIISKEDDNNSLCSLNKKVTSDVIVTPNKQSKPVSPQAGEKKTIADHPLAAHNNHQHNYHNQHHHGQHQHHGGDNNKLKGTLEKGLNKRKTSSSTCKDTTKGQHKSTGATNQPKSFLSRSSSSSVLGGTTSSTTVNGQQKTFSVVGSNANEIKQQQAISGPDNNDNIYNNSDICHHSSNEHQQQLPASSSEHFVYGDDDGMIVGNDNELLDEEEEDDFDIPVSFAVFLLIVYMMFGAVIFSIWEGWNFFDSLYFVFISMSTIGFGDLVPQHPKRMIGTFIYLLFGLALTSMCINVVQEKIHATFLRAKMQIGEKMGFDLDQIMADDYYSSVDGGAGGGCGGCSDIDCDSHSNELSQTNSSYVAINTAHDNNNCNNVKDDDLNNNNELSQYQLDDGTTVPPSHIVGAGGGSVKLSKSKESLKIKKRNVASLPGHNNNAGNSSSSSSFRRKSSKRQPLSRQSTPSASTIMAVVNNNNNEKVPLTNQNTTFMVKINQNENDKQQENITNNSSKLDKDIKPIKSEIEMVGKEPTTTHFSKSTSSNNNDNNQLPSHQSTINMPIKFSIKGICEPLLSKKPTNIITSNNNSDIVVTSGSKLDDGTSFMKDLKQQKQQQLQPIIKSHSSECPSSNITRFNPYSCDSSTTAASFRINMLGPKKHNNNSNSNTYRTNRSAGSSRRSSVSHELNQLDDLIMALKSQSKQVEKFGPLLGIPTTSLSNSSAKTTSRSNSPYNNDDQQKLTLFTNNDNSLELMTNSNYNNLTYKRGTSMTNKPTYLQQQQKQSTCNSNHQSFDFMNKYSLVSSRPSTSPTRIVSPKDREKDPSRSTVINLSASQKALAELEAIKFSAV